MKTLRMHFLERFLQRAKFLLGFPFVLAAFKWREHKRQRQIVPIKWLSPAAVVEEDLGLYDDALVKFDLKFIDDFAKARDDVLATARKQIIFSLLVFLFLLSSYFSIGLEINLGGFSIKNGRGVAEGLLLVTNLLSCYTIILQANAALLDATIKSAIKLSIPEELRKVYLARYFPAEQIGRYSPFNMPQLVPSLLHRNIQKLVAWLFLLLFAITALAFIACNMFLLIHYLWIAPSLGIWSKVLLAYILSCGFAAMSYVILVRMRLPYLDYTINNELQLLEQVDPRRHQMRLQEVFGDLNRDRKDMERRGYLQPRNR